MKTNPENLEGEHKDCFIGWSDERTSFYDEQGERSETMGHLEF